MPDQLPVRVNPYKLAEVGKTLRGSLLAANMGRLRGVVIEDALEIACTFLFLKDENNFMLHAEVVAKPVIRCQRCLQSMTFPLNRKIELVMVETDEQAERMLQEFEPWVVAEDELLELSDLVEDEVLLSLPSYPKHEHDCSIKGNTGDNKTEVDKTGGKGTNPFSVLEQLKS